MAKEKKSGWVGVLFGPGLALLALTALWKNETRFDYHRAAVDTLEITSLADATDGQTFSFTGPMDQQLTFAGNYVGSFTGYLAVYRHAEIYAWHEDKDDDGTTWRLRWMSSVESNSRNSSVRQSLSSSEFKPAQYDVGDLAVVPEQIEFVDPTNPIGSQQLELSQAGVQLQLERQGEYLYLEKNQSRDLGDERVSYSGVPVPSTATYFGKFEAGQNTGQPIGRGVADLSNQRTGFINQIIRDTGVLHFVVAGERTTALATMKSHIARLKWIVRGVGTAAVALGFLILFSSIFSFLFHLPIIGPLAEKGSFLLALMIGLPLAGLVIVSGYFAAHPLFLLLIVGLVVGGIYMVRRRGAASQVAIKTGLETQYGRELGELDMKELEFIELAQLAMSDSDLEKQESKFLKQWASKHGWNQTKYSEMLQRAKQQRESDGIDIPSDTHLTNLIRLALADGKVTPYEIRTIRQAAENVGYDSSTVREMIDRVRKDAAQQSA